MSLFALATASNLNLRLTHALLVMENRDTGEGKRQAVTTHEVMETPHGPVLGPARLFGAHEQQALAEVLLGPLAKSQVLFLPPEILVHHSTMMAWYVPGRVRPMHFNTEDHQGSYWVPWPTLIFCVHRGDLWLAGTRRHTRPTPDTPLYHAPLMNLNTHGGMCWGDVPPPKGRSLADRAAYEAAVFQSNFSHVTDEQTLRLPRAKTVSTEQHLTFWQGLPNPWRVAQAPARMNHDDRHASVSLSPVAARPGALFQQAPAAHAALWRTPGASAR
jgi:PRTRC genetic system protein B